MSSADVLFMSLIYTVVITKYYTQMENRVLRSAISHFSSELFLPLLYLGSLLLSHSDVYTHLEMPGLWDSPWSMGIGNQ